MGARAQRWFPCGFLFFSSVCATYLQTLLPPAAAALFIYPGKKLSESAQVEFASAPPVVFQLIFGCCCACHN